MTVTLESLSDSRNTLARLCLLAVKAADKTWKGVDPRRVRDSWNRTNADFLTLFATLQTRAAADAMDSSTLMLAEQSDYIQPDGGIANPLNISVTISIAILHGITRIIRVQSVSYFPRIGHTVTIGVHNRLSFVLGQSAYLTDVRNDTLFIRVCRQTSFHIRRNELRSVFHIDGFPSLHCFDNSRINSIPFRKSRSHIT